MCSSDLLLEKALQDDMTSLTTIEDTVSLAVQDQYETNPYPRWIRASVHDKAVTLAESFRTLPFWRQPEAFAPNTPAQVLIAGCGTGQQA